MPPMRQNWPHIGYLLFLAPLLQSDDKKWRCILPQIGTVLSRR